MKKELNEKPIWQLSVDELIDIIEKAVENTISTRVQSKKDKKFVCGIKGIASIFNCSPSTANRIKKSGIIDGAITQVNRKIIVDVEKAIELANANGGIELK